MVKLNKSEFSFQIQTELIEYLELTKIQQTSTPPEARAAVLTSRLALASAVPS